MKSQPSPRARAVRPPPRRLLVALVACTLGPLAFAGAPQAVSSTGNLPALGDSVRADLSPVMERKLGEEIMNDIRRDRDYLDDAPILEYLNNFGAALVASAPPLSGEINPDFFFFAVRDPMLNAFALPGGFIAVHSALVIAAQNESELASVLSHEIGHVMQHHIARSIGQQKQDSLIPLAAMIVAALAAKSNPNAAMGLYMGGQGLAIQRELDFSRDAEREADRVGFQIMGAAGFDTSGMVAFFSRMQAANSAYGDIPAYLLTHPLTSERITDIRARIRETPYRQRADSIDFHLVRARARVLQNTSQTGLADAQTAFETQLAQEGYQQQAAAQYGLAFVALKRGDLGKAQSWLDKARATAKPRAVRPGAFSVDPGTVSGDGGAIFTSLALDIKLAPGQSAAAIAEGLTNAEQAHTRYPLSRGISAQYAEALLANGKTAQAAAFLRDQVQQYRREPKLQELLAKTYAAQGKIALQHLALAEAYALSGGTMAALDQLALARKAKDASFYELAVIDARERELQERRREEVKDKKDAP